MAARKKRYKKTIIVLLLVSVFALPWFLMDKETESIDAAVRARFDGDFVRLSDGWTCYRWSGPAEGPPVVLVHGFSTPMFIWDKTAPALADKGFRTLRYDLYGRGMSDRPETVYDASLFDRQLLGLLDALDVQGPVDLVGLSMGGAVAVIFASKHPDRVRRLVLLDPAGFPVPVPAAARLIRVPLLGEYLLRVIGDKVVLDGAAKNFYRPEYVPIFQQRFREQMRYRGYKRALLSTWRNFDLQNQQAAFASVGRQGFPALLFWGREDRIVPLENSRKIMEAMPQTRLFVIEKAGHTPHYERPDAVLPILLGFLGE